MPVAGTVARGLLAFIGGTFVLCAFLSGIAALSSLAERMRHGSGPMFADVEFFAFASAVLGATGGLALWLGLRMKTGIRKAGNPDASENRKTGPGGGVSDSRGMLHPGDLEHR